jgi:ATP synthase protein I
VVPDARQFAFTVVAAQAAVTALATLLALALGGVHAAISGALGGGIGTAASLAMVLLAFRRTGDAHMLMRAFYLGEAAKVAVTVVLFVLVLKLVRVVPMALFAGFGSTFLTYWVALAMATGAPAKREI